VNIVTGTLPDPRHFFRVFAGADYTDKITQHIEGITTLAA
jgi:hypothetical protein